MRNYITIIDNKNNLVLLSGGGEFKFDSQIKFIVRNDISMLITKKEPIFNTDEVTKDGEKLIKYYPEDQP